jgi:hypothetical protein
VPGRGRRSPPLACSAVDMGSAFQLDLDNRSSWSSLAKMPQHDERVAVGNRPTSGHVLAGDRQSGDPVPDRPEPLIRRPAAGIVRSRLALGRRRPVRGNAWISGLWSDEQGWRPQVRRIYDDPADDDGIRVFVDRRWPRGVSEQRPSRVGRVVCGRGSVG